MIEKIEGNFKEVIESKVPVLIIFMELWCGLYFSMKPELFDFSEKYNIDIYQLDSDKYQYIPQFFKVISIPTFIIFKEEKEIERLSGNNITLIEELIKRNV